MLTKGCCFQGLLNEYETSESARDMERRSIAAGQYACMRIVCCTSAFNVQRVDCQQHDCGCAEACTPWRSSPEKRTCQETRIYQNCMVADVCCQTMAVLRHARLIDVSMYLCAHAVKQGPELTPRTCQRRAASPHR
jgi:hypothetical protein